MHQKPTWVRLIYSMEQQLTGKIIIIIIIIKGIYIAQVRKGHKC